MTATSLSSTPSARPSLRRRLGAWLKPIEIGGRYFLEWCVGRLLASPRSSDPIPLTPSKVLVVRLDQRVGNLLLLTPLLAALRQRFPNAELALLCHEKVDRVVAQLPFAVRRYHYVKWAFFSERSSFRLIRQLRRQGFDVAIDAGGIEKASLTHPVMTRLAGAKATIGVMRPRVGRLYSHPVAAPDGVEHEIDVRLRLLAPLANPAGARACRDMHYASEARLNGLAAGRAEWLRSLIPAPTQTVLCMVGGRLAERQLSAAEWGVWLRDLPSERELLLLFGPGEEAQAEQVAKEVVAHSPSRTVRLGPQTSLDELALLFRRARLVVGHDTGTSHLAAAVGAALCVVFIATDPLRYGHTGGRMRWIDLRLASPSVRASVAADALGAFDRTI